MKRIGLWRRFSQLFVLALFCALPLLNTYGFHEIRGSLFAFDAFGIPFADPASAVQAVLAGSFGAAWPLASFYIGAFATLGVAFFLGRVFCGWLCPYGFLSELIFRLRKKAFAGFSRKQLNVAFWLKAALLAIALAAAMFMAYPLVSLMAMPGQISLIPSMAFAGAAWGVIFSVLILPFAALFFESLAGSRLWCEYLCPQSVMLASCAWWLPPELYGLRIAWDPRKCSCGKTSPCRNACTLGLNPRQRSGPPRRDCLMCGDCIEECRKYGKALDYTFSAQGIKFKPEAKNEAQAS